MVFALRAPLGFVVLLITAVSLWGCSLPGVGGDNGTGPSDNAPDDGGGADDTERMRMNFPLDEALGSFQLQPGVPQANSGAFDIMVPFGPYETIGVDLADTSELVSVMLAVEGDGKGTVPLQSTGTAVLTWWVGPIGDQDTVCETGEKYGPYTVTLDANGRPVSVDTAWVEFTPRSTDLYNTGQFSLCIQMEATMAGTMIIESLAMDLILASTDAGDAP